MLLTRSPLNSEPKPSFAFDLHVLGTPPALILSQDQTLMLNSLLPSLDRFRSLAPGCNSLTRALMTWLLRCFVRLSYFVVRRQPPLRLLTLRCEMRRTR